MSKVPLYQGLTLCVASPLPNDAVRNVEPLDPRKTPTARGRCTKFAAAYLDQHEDQVDDRVGHLYVELHPLEPAEGLGVRLPVSGRRSASDG